MTVSVSNIERVIDVIGVGRCKTAVDDMLSVLVPVLLETESDYKT